MAELQGWDCNELLLQIEGAPFLAAVGFAHAAEVAESKAQSRER